MHLSTEEWGFLTAISPVVLGTVLGYRRLDKRSTRLEENTATLRHNGGSSLADAIRRIEVKQDASNELLANLTGRFEQHIEESRWRPSQETSHSRPRRSSERMSARSSDG